MFRKRHRVSYRKRQPVGPHGFHKAPLVLETEVFRPEAFGTGATTVLFGGVVDVVVNVELDWIPVKMSL